MTATTEKYIDLIFPEMMIHPALFTHPQPKKILLLGDRNNGMLREISKHTNVQEIHHIDAPQHDQESTNKAIYTTQLDALKSNSLDIIINANDFNPSQAKRYFELLHQDGLLIQQSVSPFAINPLKSLTKELRDMGFSDLQLLSFPQPHYESGWQSIVMALKKGMFNRLREKIVFNKPFKTEYYNFDVHKAAAVLPEFIRNSNLF